MLWFDFVAIVVGPGIVLDHMCLGISVVTAALLPLWNSIRLALASVQRIQLILLLIIVVGACKVVATHVVCPVINCVGAREDTNDAFRFEEFSSMEAKNPAIIHKEHHDDFKSVYLVPK